MFIHVARLNRWTELLDELLVSIQSHGLLEALDSLTLGIVGDGEVPRLPPRASYAFLSPDVRRFEFPTLGLLYEKAFQDPNSFCCYTHLKGLTGTSAHHEAWRYELIDFCIRLWRHRVHELQYRFTSGPRFVAGGCGFGGDFVPAYAHYSGNFWWARSDYLISLPNPSSLDLQNRFWAEAWIGQQPFINQQMSDEMEWW